MTKKLTELFNLPVDATSDEETADQAKLSIEESKDIIVAADEAMDKIDAALPMVRDLDASDKEMDELADLAKKKFEDLMDLGMNVELRFAGEIFNTAGTMLGHAITAKTAKMDKKLKMIDLQLKKMRLDKMENNGNEEKPIDGKAVVMDRNALIAEILSKNKK